MWGTVKRFFWFSPITKREHFSTKKYSISLLSYSEEFIPSPIALTYIPTLQQKFPTFVTDTNEFTSTPFAIGVIVNA